MDNSRDIYWVTEDEMQAHQACAYKNSRYLQGQKDIPSAVSNLYFKVKKCDVVEFKRHKSLFWLVIVYFDKHPSRDGFPYTICNVERRMVVDYEMEDILNLTENYTDHMYFTAPFKTKNNDLWKMAGAKLRKLVEENKDD